MKARIYRESPSVVWLVRRDFFGGRHICRKNELSGNTNPVRGYGPYNSMDDAQKALDTLAHDMKLEEPELL